MQMMDMMGMIGSTLSKHTIGLVFVNPFKYEERNAVPQRKRLIFGIPI